MATFIFSDPGNPGLWLASCLFGGISLVIGICVTQLIWRQQRKEALAMGRTPGRRWPGLLAGAIIALPWLIYFWFDFWGGYFFSLRLDSDRLFLDYYLPRRTVTLPLEQLARIDSTSEARKGLVYRLVLTDATGHDYTSQQIHGQERITQLRQQLGLALGRTIPPPR